MQAVIQRCLLLVTGAMLAGIGLAYCLDPNLLLARYDINVTGISEDNMYRGAYGGLFITLGLAIGYGFIKETFRSTATLLGLLFMGGFALGRIASIASVGVPHDQIMGLLIFEVVMSVLFAWLLMHEASQTTSELAGENA